MHSRPASASISPETVSQVGAGALLLIFAVAELFLTFWAAGWWHRSGASLVAVGGVGLLARGVAAIVPALRAHVSRV